MSLQDFFLRMSMTGFFLTSVLGLPDLTFAQSSPADTLSQIMANDASTKEEFTRVIRLAQNYEEAMYRDIAALQHQISGLSAVTGTYLTKVGDAYVPLDSHEVENLSALVALRMMLHSRNLGPIPGLETNSQLDIALRSAMEASYREWLRLYGEEKTGLYPGDFVAQMVRVTLNELTERNYQEIADKIAELEQKISELRQGIDALGDVVTQAVALRDKAPDLATVSGILNGKGYFVVRLSGGGWIKRYGGNATYSSGHEYFFVWADNKRTEPVKAYYWEFPVGYDINEQFNVWIDEQMEESRKACRDMPPLGRAAQPHIWVEGPHYEVVYGPYKGAAPEKFGSRRINNGKPGSAIQWRHESGKMADVKAVCSALGASF